MEVTSPSLPLRQRHVSLSECGGVGSNPWGFPSLDRYGVKFLFPQKARFPGKKSRKSAALTDACSASRGC